MAEYVLSPGRLVSGGAGSPPGGTDLEAGVSGGGAYRCPPGSPVARKWGSYEGLGHLTPRSGGGGARFFFDPLFDDEPRHFLDACFLCRKPLGRNRDIYMYRGDTPFCSEECRQEQIEMDEAKEKTWTLSMKTATSRKEQQQEKEKAASQGIEVRSAGAVVAI